MAAIGGAEKRADTRGCRGGGSYWGGLAENVAVTGKWGHCKQ